MRGSQFGMGTPRSERDAVCPQCQHHRHRIEDETGLAADARGRHEKARENESGVAAQARDLFRWSTADLPALPVATCHCCSDKGVPGSAPSPGRRSLATKERPEESGDREDSEDEQADAKMETDAQKQSAYDRKRKYARIKWLPSPETINSLFERVAPQWFQRAVAGDASCLIFTPDSAFRDMCNRITRWPLFEWFILINVLVVIVYYAVLDEYRDRDPAWYYGAGLYFFVVFLLELCVRVVRRGFLIYPHSELVFRKYGRPYLRVGWFWFDFIVVVTTLIALVFPVNKSTRALQAIRVILPVKALYAVPQMRLIMSGFLLVIPRMLHVVGFCSLILLIFSQVGLRMFLGRFHQYCTDGVTMYVSEQFPDGILCGSRTCSEFAANLVCAVGVPLNAPTVIFPAPNDGYSNFDNFFWSMLNIFTAVTLEGWSETMYFAMYTTTPWSSVFFVLLVIIGAYFVVNLVVAVVADVYLAFLGQTVDRERLTESSDMDPDHSLPLSPISETELKGAQGLCSGSDGLPQDLYQDQPLAENLNRRSTNLGKPDSARRGGSEEVDVTSYPVAEPGESVPRKASAALHESSATTSFGSWSSHAEHNYVIPEKVDYAFWQMRSQTERAYKACAQSQVIKSLRPARQLTERLVTHWIFEWGITFCIVANVSVLACYHASISPDFYSAIIISDFVFQIIFLIEMVLLVFALGPVRYCQNCWNLLALFINIVTSAVLFATISDGLQNVSNVAASLKAFRVLRLAFSLRLVPLVSNTVQGALRCLKYLIWLIPLFLLFWIIFAIIGKVSFGGRFFGINGEPCNQFITEQELIVFECTRHTWNTFGVAFVDTFQILTGEDWQFLMYEAMSAVSDWVFLYFVITFVMLNYILLNIFLSFVLFWYDAGILASTAMLAKLKHSFQRWTRSIKTRFSACLGLTPVGSTSVDLSFSMDEPTTELETLNKPVSRREDIPTDVTSTFPANEAELDSTRGAGIDFQDKVPGHAQATKGDVSDDGIAKGVMLASTVLTASPLDKPLPMASTLAQHPICPGSNDSPRATTQGSFVSFSKSSDSASCPPRGQEPGGSAKGGFRECLQARKDYSFLLFSSTNPVRRFCQVCDTHPLYNLFQNIVLTYSCALLIIVGPDSSPTVLDVVYYSFVVILALVLQDFILKSMARGLLLGNTAYLRSAWAWLDVLTIIYLVVDVFLVDNAQLKAAAVVFLMRSVKLILAFPGTRTVIMCLLYSIFPSLGVTVVIWLIYFIFGVWGIYLFAGRYDLCECPTGSYPICNTASIADMPNAAAMCEAMGGQWLTYPANFDNMYNALRTLFEVATLENWPPIMYTAADSCGVDKGPQLWCNPFAPVFYILFVFSGSIFALNLYIATVVDAYMTARNRQDGISILTPEQQEWYAWQRILLSQMFRARARRPPRRHKKVANWWSNLRVACFGLVYSRAYRVMMDLVVLGNTALLCMEYWRWSGTVELTYLAICCVLTMVFLLDRALSLLALGMRQFLHSRNDVLQLALVSTMVADCIVRGLVYGNLLILGPNFAPLYYLLALRAVAVLRLVRHFKTIQRFAVQMILAFSILGNVVVLLLYVFYVFAFIGVVLFGNIPVPVPDAPLNGGGVQTYACFRNFGVALLTLLRTTTGEAWNSIMWDIISLGGAYRFAWMYFFIFICISAFTISNLFVAVVIELYSSVVLRDTFKVTNLMVARFKRAWKRYDPDGIYTISVVKDLRAILRECDPPLGVGSDATTAELFDFLERMDPHVDQDGRISFSECLRCVLRMQYADAEASFPEHVREQLREDHRVRAGVKNGFQIFTTPGAGPAVASASAAKENDRHIKPNSPGHKLLEKARAMQHKVSHRFADPMGTKHDHPDSSQTLLNLKVYIAAHIIQEVALVVLERRNAALRHMPSG
ncbi:Sodium channel protein type 11 subunit alpha [Porphyridium purpureum]|uniref:Sodium channel protein type 11 subunit alpha n=1 Tax=Porphyridium purpureum TaxID=35688 RepID=A0A5J4YPS3_PORPP|nr:Sodium channel protein type 11 subunit alpha [Porphyridium purpureum]|eukprot:POR2006..scf296_7